MFLWRIWCNIKYMLLELSECLSWAKLLGENNRFGQVMSLSLFCLHFKLLCHPDILTLLTRSQWPHRSVKESFLFPKSLIQNAEHRVNKTCLCRVLKWAGTSLIEKNAEGIPPILCFLCGPFILIGRATNRKPSSCYIRQLFLFSTLLL